MTRGWWLHLWTPVSSSCKKMAQRFKRPLTFSHSLVPDGDLGPTSRGTWDEREKEHHSKLVSSQHGSVVVLLSVKDLLRSYSVKLLSPHSILINQLSSRTVPSIPLELCCLVWWPPATYSYSHSWKWNKLRNPVSQLYSSISNAQQPHVLVLLRLVEKTQNVSITTESSTG